MEIDLWSRLIVQNLPKSSNRRKSIKCFREVCIKRRLANIFQSLKFPANWYIKQESYCRKHDGWNWMVRASALWFELGFYSQLLHLTQMVTGRCFYQLSHSYCHIVDYYLVDNWHHCNLWKHYQKVLYLTLVSILNCDAIKQNESEVDNFYSSITWGIIWDWIWWKAHGN